MNQNKICSNCGTINDINSTMCLNCGNNLNNQINQTVQVSQSFNNNQNAAQNRVPKTSAYQEKTYCSKIPCSSFDVGCCRIINAFRQTFIKNVPI